ncbi:hypothetical protein [Adonisia turfae]|uniref:hypothetical protein n=1 Tax=Adonisia turfae TaxID=2950184 RepID=UPI002029B19C|nr:hypothetical protein [Adonisia turfae]
MPRSLPWSIPIGLVFLWATPAPAKDIALTFDSPPTKTEKAPTRAVSLSFAPKPTQTSPTPITQVIRHALETLFHGGSNSLVAHAVGNAEGTRTPDGGYTAAYYGHIDPGNHKWNLGSFSYQHGAKSPADADAKQLKRLYKQALVLRQQASQHQVTLSLAEELNGIDLANQAPLAALDRGYIDWLAIARQQSMSEADRIIWATRLGRLRAEKNNW